MLRLSGSPSKFNIFPFKSRQDILNEILYSVTRITNQGGQVTFLWVPAHIGVKGNEKVDKVAKKALKKEKVEMQIRISKAEVKCIIWEKVNHEWQEMWDNEGKGRHLYQIQKSVKVNKVGCGNMTEDDFLWYLFDDVLEIIQAPQPVTSRHMEIQKDVWMRLSQSLL